MAQIYPTRRAVVAGACTVLVGALLGSTGKAFAVEADTLRPPGALTESEFIARCNRCERCISVCPTDIIRPMTIEEGVVSVRTPELTFASGSCIFCDKCRQVCPTQAIGTIDPLNPAAGRIGVAVVHEDLCLAFLEPGSCGICKDACPYGAISFDGERRPVVDASKCNGCGECERICPANVYTSFSGGQTRGVEVMTEKDFEAEGGAL
jgi:ferredoxin-type protein NapG